MKLGILAYLDKVQLLDVGHDSESNIFGVMPLFNLEFLTDEHYHLMLCSCLTFCLIPPTQNEHF
jgi:hypothetical protein